MTDIPALRRACFFLSANETTSSYNSWLYLENLHLDEDVKPEVMLEGGRSTVMQNSGTRNRVKETTYTACKFFPIRDFRLIWQLSN